MSTGNFVIEDKVLKQYTGKETTVVIPDEVETIAAFEDCGPFSGKKSAVEVLILGKGITRIKSYAFFYHSTIKEIAFNSDNVTIEKDAFLECYNLEKVDFPDNVTIEEGAFSRCTKLCDSTGFFIFNRVLMAFDDELYFANNDNYRESGEVIIPAGVKRIDPEAFRFRAVKVICNDELEEIAPSAFKNNGTIEEIVLNSNLKAIGDKAFEGCDQLKSVIGGINVESVGSEAFGSCYNLTSVDFSEKSNIAENAFRDCTELVDENGMLINNGVLIAFHLAKHNNNMPSHNDEWWIVIPDSVTAIKGINMNFPGEIIDYVRIPSSLKSIDPNDWYISVISKLEVIDENTGEIIYQTSFMDEPLDEFILFKERFCEFCRNPQEYITAHK